MNTPLIGQWRIDADPTNSALRQAIQRVNNNLNFLEKGFLYENRYGGGKTLTQIVSETWLDNPKMTNEALIAKTGHTISDIKKTISDGSNQTMKERFTDYTKDPLQLLAAELKAIFITDNPESIAETTEQILETNAGYGLTGPGDATPWAVQRYSVDDPIGVRTAIHDNTSIDDEINKQKYGKEFVDQNSENQARWGYKGDVVSALAMFFENVYDAPSHPLTTTGMIGSAVGGQIADYFADDSFANQLLSRSVGSTVGGWVGDTVEQFIVFDQSIGYLTLPNTLASNLISNAVSLGAGELSDYLIEEFKIEAPLAQIGVSTLINQSVSYGVALGADYLFGEEIAIKYFGSTGDLSIGNFGSQLVNAGASALGGYFGSDLYNRFIDWNIFSEGYSLEGAAIGGSLGGLAAGLIGGITIGTGTTLGVGGLAASYLGAVGVETTIASSIGTYLGAGATFAGPVGIFVLALAGTFLGSALGGIFGDEDFPRAGYLVTIENGQFVYRFDWVADDGNEEIARVMAENATDFLNYIASAVGGQVYATGNNLDDIFFYGHYLEDYFYKPLRVAPDAAGGSSSWKYPYRFDSIEQAIITGVREQIGNAIIEGGDRFQKRALLTTNAGNFADLAKDIAIAKEYGIAKDNWALHQEFIEDLRNNAISDADEDILDLRDHPWDAFTPPEDNPVNVYQVPEGFTLANLEVKLDNEDTLDLIIEHGDSEHIEPQWIGTQPENKTQYIRLEDDNLYKILVIGNLPEDYDENENDYYQTYFINGQRRESVKAIDVVPGKSNLYPIQDEDVRITRNGNDLIIDNTIEKRTLENAAINGEVILLNFPSGKVRRVVFNTYGFQLKQEVIALNLERITPSNIKDFGIDILPSKVTLIREGNDLIINGERHTNWINATEKIELLRFANGNTFKIVVNGNNVELKHEFVANWDEISARANQLNLDASQPSDYYKGSNATLIVYGNTQGENDSGDVIISTSANETLRGLNGDDVYVYSLGDGIDTIIDSSGLDELQLDSNITLNQITVQISGSNIILNFDAQNKITLSSFTSNPIEIIRLGDNQEYFIKNINGTWQLTPANSIQVGENDNITVYGTIGSDIIRGLGNNDTLAGGAGDDTYFFSLGDGINTTIQDIGDYQGVIRDGGNDILVINNDNLNSLKLVEKDLIIIVDFVKNNDGNLSPLTITIKNWTEENNKIEIIRMVNGDEYYPVADFEGNVFLQPIITAGESTLDVELDVPDSYLYTDFSLAVVDLTGNGLQLIPATASNTLLDVDNDEYLEQIGWVTSSDALLVWDKDNDGLITNLNEYISLANYAETTFIGSLDSNNDKILNRFDANFENLRLWSDNNGNQKVELGEFLGLHRIGIDEIAIEYQNRDFEVAGNKVTASTYFSQLGYEFRKRSQIYDVSFAYNPEGVKFEELTNGLSQFDFEDKPNILIGDDTTPALDLTIDPTVTYSVTGGKNNDKLTVKNNSSGEIIFNGGDGNDTIIGGAGNDILNGGEGKDVLEGKGGDDIITVDRDDDLSRLDGGEGFDIVALAVENTSYFIFNDSHNIETIIGSNLANRVSYSGQKNMIISGDNGNDTLEGGSGDDQIEGGEDNDLLLGSNGNDLLLGGLGNDSLYGGNGNDQLYGQSGDDQLYGEKGNDTLDGGIGNDTLIGGEGNNTFNFGLNYGIDTIDNIRGVNTLKFLEGIKPTDVTFWRNPSDYSLSEILYISIKNTHDRLIIKNQFWGNDKGIGQFIFTDGTVWTRENIRTWLLQGTDKDDYLAGYHDLADTLDGKKGNDTLAGGNGNDIYIFGRDYGVDTIDDGDGLNILKFKEGINPADVTFWRNPSASSLEETLYISIKNTHDRLIIKNQFWGNTRGINQFIFANGTVWTRDNIQARLLQSTNGDDYLLGYNGDDTLDGGLGNDSLQGGQGNNIYRFGVGYGVDTILSNYNDGIDTISFNAGINSTDITFWRNTADSKTRNNLYLAINNTSDRLIIENQFYGSTYGVDKLIFADGTIVTREAINTMLLPLNFPQDNLVKGDKLRRI